MKIETIETIEIPEGINIEIENRNVKIKKENLEVDIQAKGKFKIKKDGNKLVLSNEKATKNHKRAIKTNSAKIRNVILGLQKKYVYKLQICHVHFPVSVSIKDDTLIIKNFLGEKKERKAKIIAGVNVTIEKDIITVESHDKEKAGQTSANIESSTKIRKRDRRIFQDGIFMIEKCKGVKKK
jgi:large subunit ribosomal protein L6